MFDHTEVGLPYLHYHNWKPAGKFEGELGGQAEAFICEGDNVVGKCEAVKFLNLKLGRVVILPDHRN